jgi:hypothetical protein
MGWFVMKKKQPLKAKKKKLLKPGGADAPRAILPPNRVEQSLKKYSRKKKHPRNNEFD